MGRATTWLEAVSNTRYCREMPVMVSQLGDLHNLVHFCAHFLHCLGPFSFHCWVKEQQILKKKKNWSAASGLFYDVTDDS